MSATRIPVDRDAILARLAGDEQLCADAMVIFLEDCPGRLDDVRSALEGGDPRMIRAAAHALKGPAAILAAPDLFEAAQTIEGLGDEGKIDDARTAWPRLVDAAHAVSNALRQFEDVRSRCSHACSDR
jgi:HPt (histidine-containing phosphotransfer) domain-containing protein